MGGTGKVAEDEVREGFQAVACVGLARDAGGLVDYHERVVYVEDAGGGEGGEGADWVEETEVGGGETGGGEGGVYLIPGGGFGTG